MQEKTRKTMSGVRSLTRLYVIQLMYRSKFDNKPLKKLLIEAKEKPEIHISEDISLNSIDLEFLNELVNQTTTHMETIDQLIKEHISESWNFERFDTVMQCLLQLAVCELLYFDDIHANVVFNEYIEIAKAFFKKKEVSFVNGILHTISVQIKSEKS